MQSFLLKVVVDVCTNKFAFNNARANEHWFKLSRGSRAKSARNAVRDRGLREASAESCAVSIAITVRNFNRGWVPIPALSRLLKQILTVTRTALSAKELH